VGINKEDVTVGKLIMVIAALLLSACVVQPKTGTESIRIVGDNHGCKVITNVTGEGAWGRNKSEAAEDAVNQVKNRAAAAGANAVYFEDVDSRFWGSMMLAEALYCS
jgi:uncharacterized protein YbjQ (UPF0145 family)